MRDDPQARALHTRGKSLSDLLRLRAGEADDAPDLVLLPGSHEEVLAVLAICSEQRVAVVPFGGGTSVVGGLEPSGERFAGVVAVDVRRLDRLVEVDDESRIATLEPGLRSPQAEALLSEHGFTIGHFPQSFEYATIGGAAAAARQRPGLCGLRALRRARRPPAPGDAERDARARARAQVRGGPGSAPADPGIGGRVRRDHLAGGGGESRSGPAGV
jgi:hypothetical protein